MSLTIPTVEFVGAWHSIGGETCCPPPYTPLVYFIMNIRTHYTHTHMHSQRGMKYKEVSMIRKMIKGLHMAEPFCFDSLFISFCTFHHSPSFFPLLSRSVHITLAAAAYLRSQLAAPMQGKSFRIIFLELHHWQLEH